MSFFDAHSPRGAVHDDGLWQEPSQALAAGPTSPPRPPAAEGLTGEAQPAGPEADAWSRRLEDALSAGLSNDVAVRARQDADRVRRRAAFDSWRAQCAVELVPVLERSAQMLREWGLAASVSEAVTDQPPRLPRRSDVVLRIARFGDRGPGKLTISATEASEVVRITLKMGPLCIGGEADERVGMTTTRDLSGELVGGLIATLVEQLFS